MDNLLSAKLRDGWSLSQKRPSFLGFLTEEETALCRDWLGREKDARFLFWGGYEDAERVMIGFFPDYLEPAPELFPVVPLTFSFRREFSLSHRDFLGAFMALGIERDVVGDILVGEGMCVAFIRREMEPYFVQNLSKIGRVGVDVLSGLQGPLPLKREFEECGGVIASERLDCLVALLCRVSREKAAGFITEGLVARNHRETLSVSEHVEEGDIISIRRQGKFIIDQLGPLTKKGRVSVRCRKYK